MNSRRFRSDMGFLPPRCVATDRHCRQLRPCHQQPRCRCAAEQRDEFD